MRMIVWSSNSEVATLDTLSLQDRLFATYVVSASLMTRGALRGSLTR